MASRGGWKQRTDEEARRALDEWRSSGLSLRAYARRSGVTSSAQAVEVDVHELSMLLEGIDATASRVSRRWEPPAFVRA